MDPLETLLHRCHRAELLPLAAILGVRAEPLGLGDLARVLSATLRQGGSHGLANAVLRKGGGLPYPELLRRVAQDLGATLAPGADDAAVERALLAAHFRQRWDQVDAATRAALWTELGVAVPVPASGQGALDVASQSLGRRFDYMLARASRALAEPRRLAVLALLAVPLGCLLRPVLLPLTPLLVWWKLRPDQERLAAAVLEVARLRQTVLHRVTIGVVGSPSSGKDAGIKALFGIDTGNISPIAGSTKEVAIQRAPGATALYLVNTPGMGDVVERVTEEARQVLDHIDVYVYVVNAEGGVQAREKADYDRCVGTGKPVLAVVNKIDVLRPRDKERYLTDARGKLGAPVRDFVAAAFDPLPELAPGPIGLDAVHDWLRDRLTELGKDPDELPPLPAAGGPRAEDP